MIRQVFSYLCLYVLITRVRIVIVLLKAYSDVVIASVQIALLQQERPTKQRRNRPQTKTWRSAQERAPLPHARCGTDPETLRLTKMEMDNYLCMGRLFPLPSGPRPLKGAGQCQALTSGVWAGEHALCLADLVLHIELIRAPENSLEAAVLDGFGHSLPKSARLRIRHHPW